MINRSQHFMVIFFMFFMSTAIAAALKHCTSESSFNSLHASELDNKTLKSLFDQSKNKLGEGKFGIVKSIPWKLESGEVISKAVKKIPIETQAEKEKAGKEIDNLLQLKGKEFVLQMEGCVEVTEKGFKTVRVDGKDITLDVDRDYFYIVLEKLFGDLQDNIRLKSPFMRFKALSMIRKMELSLQLAEGLKSIHDEGLVHGDLKPENVMAVDETLEKLKIIDLGLAAKSGSPFLDSSIIYVDLDAINTGLLKNTFDTNSFGVTIAAMIFGEFSFSSNLAMYFEENQNEFTKKRYTAIKELLRKNKKWRKQPESNINDSFEDILLSCIDLKVDKRPSDETLIRRLNEAITEAKRIDVVRKNKPVDLVFDSSMVPYQNALEDTLVGTNSAMVNEDGVSYKRSFLVNSALIGMMLLGLFIHFKLTT